MENYEVEDGSSGLRLEISQRNARAKALANEIGKKANDHLIGDIQNFLGKDLEKKGISREELRNILGDSTQEKSIEDRTSSSNEDKDR